MDFRPTESQEMIAQTVRDFAEKHIRPNIMEWDEAQKFPIDLFKKMGELGIMGVLVPEQHLNISRFLTETMMRMSFSVVP